MAALEIENLTAFPETFFRPPEETDPKKPFCLCVKARVRLVDGQVAIEDDSLEPPQFTVGVRHDDFSTSLIHDSDFVPPKERVDVVLEASYRPAPDDGAAESLTATFQIVDPQAVAGRPPEPGVDTDPRDPKRLGRVLLDKSIRIFPERWLRRTELPADKQGDPPRERVTLVKGHFTPFDLRAEFAHGGVLSQFNKYGMGLDVFGESGVIPVARQMPMDIEYHKWTEDAAAAGFHAVEKNDMTRARFFGTVDEKWQKYRMPRPPEDFSLRYYNFAPADQQLDHDFQGGEIFRFFGFGDGPRRFMAIFPYIRLGVYLREEKAAVTPEEAAELQRTGKRRIRVREFHLRADTILVDLIQQTMEISWRCLLPQMNEAEYKTTLIIFDESQRPQATALLEGDPVGRPAFDESAELEKFLAMKEVQDALAGQQPPKTLADLAAILQEAVQSRLDKAVADIASNPAVLQAGVRLPGRAEIEALAGSAKSPQELAAKLGLGG